MEKKSPPLPESKFKFFYFLPKAIKSSEPSPRTPTPRLNKKTAGSPSMSVNNNESFRFRGPRSPKVSCIGYVVNKGNNKKRKEEKNRRKKNDSKGKEHWDAVVASRSNPSLHILELVQIFKKKCTKLVNPYEESSSSYSPPGAVHHQSVPKLGNANKRKDKRNGAVVVQIENIVLVPRKEINLWKKRMVAPPPPLRV